MGQQLDEQLENARQLIREHEAKVLRALYPETEGRELKEGDFSIRRGIGNPSSIHYKIEDIVNGTKYAFSARFYRVVPDSYKGEMPQAQKAYLSSLFLREQAGIQQVPRVVFLPEAPQWLFTEFITGKTLRELLEGEKDPKEKAKVLERILDLMASYQYKATTAANALPNEDRKKLLWSRSIEEQALDYLRAYISDEGEVTEVANAIYLPLIGSTLRGTSVCHGDLSPDNIMFDEGKKIFFVIDHELKERNEFADPGSLIAYLGDYETHLRKLAEEFALLKFRLLSEGKGIGPRVDLLTKLVEGPYPYHFRGEEGRKLAHFELSGNVLHYSLRIIAKRKKDEDVNYMIQEQNLKSVLSAFMKTPERFGLTNEQAGLAEKLKNTLDFKEAPAPEQIENKSEDKPAGKKSNGGLIKGVIARNDAEKIKGAGTAPQ